MATASASAIWTNWGLVGLAGTVDSDFNVFHAASGACVFADTRPGSTRAGSGPCRVAPAVVADGASTESQWRWTLAGRLSGGATGRRGAPLPAVVDDLQRVVPGLATGYWRTRRRRLPVFA